MTGIVLTVGSIGLVCAAGFGIATGLQWFHAIEIDPRKRKSEKPHKERSGSSHSDRINSLSKRLKES